MPFTVSERDGVLTLTLDTPGSPVNVFNTASATQLTEILASLRPETTRAVVFRSAKPNSFLNGVGLLLAHASREREDVLRAAEIPWAAYRAIVRSPVPTIALVQGTCFGCGVELALSCSYRIATDSGETQFYMTELADYLFIPLFGSTWNLPATVGLADAVDLLLWGERWGADRALARGLVDEVVPFEGEASHVERFVERVVDGRQASRARGVIRWGAKEHEVVERARARIATLPVIYQEVYSDALELLRIGARQVGTYDEHQRRELERSAASALAPIGKAAYAFFYLRQMAAERAAGRPRAPEEPLALSIERLSGAPAHAFAETLRGRRFPGAELVPAHDAEIILTRPDDTAHVSTSMAAPRVAVLLAPTARSGSSAAVYAPLFAAGGRLLELADPDGEVSDPVLERAMRRLARALQRFGFEVARTRPARTFLTNRLLTAFLSPLARYVDQGGERAAVGATLRELGFVRSVDEMLALLGGPCPTLALLDRGTSMLALLDADAATLASPGASGSAATAAALARLAAPTTDIERGRPAPELQHGLFLSLLDAALEARAERVVPDPSVIDLVARELLDFPRHLVSLCSWLERGRAAEALASPAAVRLVPESVLESAELFARTGRELYR